MGFEELDVWKRSVKLSADIYKHCKDLKGQGNYWIQETREISAMLVGLMRSQKAIGSES